LGRCICGHIRQLYVVAKISQHVNKNVTKVRRADFGLVNLLHLLRISRDLAGGYPAKTDKKICATTKP
jgi:hypothetical protein